MVKVDPKTDYYAELDLPPSADAEEIKKQFRKLAKRYHPDRNPGHEVEVVPRFQALQAAHEILSDPQQKAKYDVERAKLDNKPTTPFRRNPQPPPPPHSSNTFGPPPRRSTTGVRGTHTPGWGKPPASAGADKYASFARANAQQRDRVNDDMYQKWEAARGFRSMRGEQAQPPPPPRSSGHPTASRPGVNPNIPDHVPRVQRSWEAFPNTATTGFPGMSRTVNPRKPTGFDPGTRGGDEPPAPKSSAYHSYSQGQRPQTSKPHSYIPDMDAPPPPSVRRKEPEESPLRHTQSSTDLDDFPRRPERPVLDRISTKYAHPSGEKTYVSGVNRSSSVRNSPVDRNWPEDEISRLNRPNSHHGPSARHQSASPKISATRNADGVSSSSSESSDDADETEIMASRPNAQRRPKRQPAGSGGGGFNFRHVAADDPALTAQFPNTNYRTATSNKVPSPQEEHTARYEYPPPQSHPPPSQRPEATGPRTHPEPPSGFRYVRSSTNGFDDRHAADINQGYSHVYPQNAARSGDAGHQQNTEPRFHSVSQENINKPFSSADWESAFDSEADIFRPPENRERKSAVRSSRPRARSVGKGRGPSPEKVRRGSEPHANTNGDAPHDGPSASEKGERVNHHTEQPFRPGSFDAEEWAQKLKDQTWATPNNELNPGRSKTPKRPSKSGSARRPTVPPTVPPGPTTSHPSEEAAATAEAAATPNNANVDAMDIDIDESISETTSFPPSGDANFREARQNGATMPSPARERVSLNNLANVAPFAPSSTGLKDLDDLSASLPFESRPAPKVTLRYNPSHSSSELGLPKPPKPILPPDSGNLNRQTLGRYTTELKAYFHDWCIFNRQMIDHFRARQEQIETTMASNWISMQGDGPLPEELEEGRKAGYTTFMAWAKEDAVVREWWDVANERMAKSFEGLGQVREKVKSFGGNMHGNAGTAKNGVDGAANGPASFF